MTLPKNELVPTLNGYKIRYQNDNPEGRASWLCNGTYWGQHESEAIVFGSKFVATVVAIFWDHKRQRAYEDMNR